MTRPTTKIWFVNDFAFKCFVMIPFFQIAEQIWEVSWSMPVFQEFWRPEKLCSIGASREWPEITSKSDSSPISVQTNFRLMNGEDLWNLSSKDSENSKSHMNLLILFGKYTFPGNGTHLLWNKYFGTTIWISVILVRIKAVNHLNHMNHVSYVNRVNYVTKSDHPRLWSREDLFHSITNVAT